MFMLSRPCMQVILVIPDFTSYEIKSRKFDCTHWNSNLHVGEKNCMKLLNVNFVCSRFCKKKKKKAKHLWRCPNVMYDIISFTHLKIVVHMWRGRSQVIKSLMFCVYLIHMWKYIPSCVIKANSWNCPVYVTFIFIFTLSNFHLHCKNIQSTCKTYFVPSCDLVFSTCRCRHAYVVN